MSDEVADDVVSESPEVEASSAPVETPEAQASQPEPQQQEVWSAFRQLPEFQGQDDRSIAQRLYEAMQREAAAARALQQYQSIVPVAQEYLQNRPAYEEWRNSRSQPQQAPAVPANQPAKPEEPSWWNPPKVRDSYRRYLVRDENGREVISQDAPLDARAALEDYQTYRAEFAQKFLDNPEQAIGPMVEKVAIERAQTIVDERLERMQSEAYVSGLERENRDWLYDEKGNVSAEGLAVQKYIQDAKGLGIQGAKARWDYATKMVERDLMLSTIQQSRQPQQPQQSLPQPQPQPQPTPQPTAAQTQMDFLRQQAMRTASQRSSATTAARTPQKAMTFEERLLAAAQEQGLL
jgi:hypothetical protein